MEARLTNLKGVGQTSMIPLNSPFDESFFVAAEAVETAKVGALPKIGFEPEITHLTQYC